MGKINRVTMFKIPNEEDVKAALTAYTKLSEDHSKDGKPYILAVKAAKLYPDPRSQGYTLAAHTSFSSLEDMKYYDEDCAAHKALKGVLGPKVDGGPKGVLTWYADA
ncbi:stress responsive A/B barrel domain protein [Tothia fuscella]|uniref:Stress responsive A/B barrel domain protein n=1 Tax=Tothia fuscella TaxID=1048955 RepID=A0A9P4NZ80_9PEZI|nr:stress responsive A/B barrel domain protein [Tothia fuscella]